MRVRASDGLALELSERGEGPPVLLVHGFGGSGAAWGEPALAGLASRHRVLAVDLIGHGASDDPGDATRTTLDRVLDDLERALDAAGVSACPWIGYSMGGRITLAASLLRSDRLSRMVLESASPGLASDAERADRRASDETLARWIEENGIDAWAEAWEENPLFTGRAALPAAARDGFLAQRRANRAPALAAWLRGVGTGSQPSFWDRLGQVRVPTLILTGARDPKFSDIGRRMAAAIPDARRMAVPGAGHTVHLELPAAWLAAVSSFLD